MNSFIINEAELNGAYIIHNGQAEDNRGEFIKDFEVNAYSELGIKFCCTETFFSLSKKNVVRGLHFQIHKPQAKLVTVLNGSVRDIIVDLRKESPTFGVWKAYELSKKENVSLYIPRGFAHGFVALEDNTLMSYKCDGVYDKETDTGIYAFDNRLKIDWGIKEVQAIMNERDSNLMLFDKFEKEYGGLGR